MPVDGGSQETLWNRTAGQGYGWVLARADLNITDKLQVSPLVLNTILNSGHVGMLVYFLLFSHTVDSLICPYFHKFSTCKTHVAFFLQKKEKERPRKS